MPKVNILPKTLEQFIARMECSNDDASFFDLSYLNKYPLRDGILKFEFNKDYNNHYKYTEEFENTISNLPGNIVVAGSAALRYLLIILEIKEKDIKWKQTDTDLFMLGCDTHFRFKFNNQLDMVGIKDKTPEELLLNFDLPICRVAIGLNRTIYVSIQCLKAILTGECWIPAYLRNNNKLRRIFLDNYPAWNKEKSSATEQGYYGLRDGLLNILCKRMEERLKKYQGRGYKMHIIETDEVIPWIKNRFFYAEDDDGDGHINNLPQ